MKKNLLQLFLVPLLAFLGGLSFVHAQYSVATNCATFTDISVTGTSVGTISDDSEHNITLPFSFTFDGVAYTTASLGNNGVFMFGTIATPNVGWTNAALPTTLGAGSGTFSNAPALCPYWEDLLPGTGASINTQQIGSIFYIQWTNEDAFGAAGTGTITFQIQLEQTTNIVRFAYLDAFFAAASPQNYGGSATIGLQFTGTTAQQYSTNTQTLSDGFSICYTPPLPCAGTPTPGNTLTSINNVCPSQSFTLSFSGPLVGSGHTYQWQSGPTSGGPWTNMGTLPTQATSQVFETYYQCVVTCPNSMESAASTPLLVTMATAIPDDPCSAILITANPTCTYTTGNNACATLTTGPPAPGCASLVEKDIWYKVVVPYGGSLTIQTDAAGGFTDSGLAIYSSSDNTCTGTFTLIECDDDDSPNGFFSLITRTDFVVGSTVFIRIWEYGGGTVGPINICVITNITDPCLGTVATVPPTNGTTYMADYQCPDATDITFMNYFDNNGTPLVNTDDYLLLSIDKLSNPNIGSIGDGTFAVQVSGAAGASWITNPTAPYVQDDLFIVMNRWWNVTPNCVTCGSTPNIDADANVRFYFTQQDYDDVVSTLLLGGADPLAIAQTPGDLFMYKINEFPGPYDANPANAHADIPVAPDYNQDGYWEYEPGVASSGTTWSKELNAFTGSLWGAEFTVVAFSGGGGGGGSNGGGAFPIELIYFTGHAEATANVIEWATATEKNNQYQIIERSANGTGNWSEIGRKAGAGNSTQTISYKLLDEAPLPNGYYRLRAVDFDGQEQLSDVIFIQRTSDVLEIVNAYPVPVAKNLTLTVNAPASGKITVRVSDLSGKLLSEKTYGADRGINSLELDMTNLAAGSYQVVLTDGVSSVTSNIVKQ